MLQPHITSLTARLRFFHQWVLTRIWRVLILIADKERWRGTIICDISPTASKTGPGFRSDVLKILRRIEHVEPAAADLISRHVLCIAHSFPLRGMHSYSFVDRLLLLNVRAFEESFGLGDAAEKDAAIARSFLEGATWGQLYSSNFTLFGDRAAAAREWGQQAAHLDAFERRIRVELELGTTPTA